MPNHHIPGALWIPREGSAWEAVTHQWVPVGTGDKAKWQKDLWEQGWPPEGKGFLRHQAPAALGNQYHTTVIFTLFLPKLRKDPQAMAGHGQPE